MRAARRAARATAPATLLALAVVLPALPAGPAVALAPPGSGPVSRPGDRGTAVRDTRGARVGVVRTAAATPAAGRAVRTYWTRARMLAARPARVHADTVPQATVPQAAPASLSASTRGRVGRDVPAIRTGTAPRATVDATGTRWNAARAAVGRTTGKVFFTLGGSDYVCSGSAVESADASTVLTAGHCVDEGGDGGRPGARATDWIFVPGYASGRAPFGSFVATHLATTSGWHLSGDFDVDVGFADVGRNERGQTLAQAVGGQRIGFARPRGGRAIAIGYPAAAPFTGERLTYCAGSLLQDTWWGSPDQGLRCDMTGGSSGGPWVTGYDPETGTGTVVAVTSFGYDGLPGYLWGTYLGATARSLFSAVQGTRTR